LVSFGKGTSVDTGKREKNGRIRVAEKMDSGNNGQGLSPPRIGGLGREPNM